MSTSVVELCEQHQYVKAVIKYVQFWQRTYPNKGVTFDMLERLLIDYIPVKGDETIDLPKAEGIVFWVGCSKEFKDIVLEAISTFEIHGDGCQREAYFDKRMLPYMIAQPSDYKRRPLKLKWQPLWLKSGSGVPGMDSAPVIGKERGQ